MSKEDKQHHAIADEDEDEGEDESTEPPQGVHEEIGSGMKRRRWLVMLIYAITDAVAEQQDVHQDATENEETQPSQPKETVEEVINGMHFGDILL